MSKVTKKILKVVAVAGVFVTAGCAGKGPLMDSVAAGNRTGVFERLEQASPPLPDYADLHISSSIKTHRENAFVVNSCKHGSADFALLLNVDGQAMQLKGNMLDERLDTGDRSDPEAGNGCRYRFEALVRLKAGKHAVTVAVPEDGVVVSRNVHLQEGANYLTVKPVYRKPARSRKVAVPGEPGFQGGVKEVLLLVNGKEI